MAEITSDQVKRLCEGFLPAYNKEHGSNFELDEEVPKGSYADFFILDPQAGTKIPVQHVRAMENPVDDIVKPERAGRFVRRLLEVLESDGISGVFLSLGVQNVPRDVDDLVYRVADFVAAELSWPPTIFRLDVGRDFDSYGLKGLLDHIPSIEIRRIDREGVVVGWDCADVPTSPHLDDQQVLEKTIERKRKKYGGGLSGTILLVEAWPLPFWSFYMEKARRDRAGDTSGFKEIWAVSEGSATRIA